MQFVKLTEKLAIFVFLLLPVYFSRWFSSHRFKRHPSEAEPRRRDLWAVPGETQACAIWRRCCWAKKHWGVPSSCCGPGFHGYNLLDNIPLCPCIQHWGGKDHRADWVAREGVVPSETQIWTDVYQYRGRGIFLVLCESVSWAKKVILWSVAYSRLFIEENQALPFCNISTQSMVFSRLFTVWQ